MKRKITAILLAVALCAAGAAVAVSATPTASTVLVNGNSVAFDAYNIDGNNYFKLRDLCLTGVAVFRG